MSPNAIGHQTDHILFSSIKYQKYTFEIWVFEDVLLPLDSNQVHIALNLNQKMSCLDNIEKVTSRKMALRKIKARLQNIGFLHI